jgi:hypothetical protein
VTSAFLGEVDVDVDMVVGSGVFVGLPGRRRAVGVVVDVRV